MNHIPGTRIRLMLVMLAEMLVVSGTASAQTDSPEPDDQRIYGADYSIRPDESRGGAYVELTIAQNEGLLRELSMPFQTNSISEIRGDGQVLTDGGRIRWQPPSDGGRLRWFAKIDHMRGEDAYDAYIGDEWALFRAEDVIPPTATRTLKRSHSKTRLMFDLPNGWSAVTEYFSRGGVHDVANPERRFDRPTGWIVLGELGVRRDTIAGVRVVVAAPVGQDVRRLDILAMFNWTLPELLRLLPHYPRRLTVVSAGEPMWRGALSAPASFYVHADRPLISENGTSTIMHEAIHVGLGGNAVNGADWIVEGLAEYYSLELLRRSGTISEKRYRSARTRLADWGRRAKSLCAPSSTGAATALAVSLLADLNNEISRNSKNRSNLDDVMRRLAHSTEKLSIRHLRQIAEDLSGVESEVLSNNDLNNCEN